MTKQPRSTIAPSKATTNQSDNEIDLYQLLSYLKNNLLLIITLALLFSLGGYVLAQLKTPIYEVDALIHVEKKSTGASALGGMADFLPQESQSSTEIEIIKSRMVIGEVVDQLDLTTQVSPVYVPYIGNYLARRSGAPDRVLIKDFEVPPEYISANLQLVFDHQQFTLLLEDKTILTGIVGDPLQLGEWRLHIVDVEANNTNRFNLVKQSRKAVVYSYQRQLNVVERGRMTGIIEVSIQSANKESAKEFLEAVTNEYMLQNIRRTAAEAEKSLEFLNNQIPTVRQNLVQAEEELNSYRLQNRSVDLSLETSGVLNMVLEVEKQLNELNIKETEMSRLFTREHPSYQALLKQKNKLLADQERLTKQVESLPETQQQVLRLTRDVQVNQEIYLQLVNRTQELKIVKAGTVGNVRVIDTAEIGIRPVSPNKRMILVISFFMGILASVVWIMLEVSMRQGVESVEQLEEEGISVCASIPQSELQSKLLGKAKKQAKKTKRKSMQLPLLFDEQPDDMAVEAILGLRTYLHFAMAEARNNVVMISGSSPEVGKSFICINLALALAQGGKRVLLVDADLRRGILHHYLNCSKTPGLSGLLSEGSITAETVAAAVHVTEFDGLHFLPNGKATSYPSELLMGQGFTTLLDVASADYDCVLIDTPPILAVTDPEIVGRNSGTNLLVVRYGKTQLKEVGYAIQRFDKSGIEINGVILNGVRRRRTDNYDYEYQYGYSYKSHT